MRVPVPGERAPGELSTPGELLPGKPEPGGVAVGNPVDGLTPPTVGCPVRGSIEGRAERGAVVPVGGTPVRGSVGEVVGSPVRGSVVGGNGVLGSDGDDMPVPRTDGVVTPVRGSTDVDGTLGETLGNPVRGSTPDGVPGAPSGALVRGEVVCASAVAATVTVPSTPIATNVQAHAFMTYLPSQAE